MITNIEGVVLSKTNESAVIRVGGIGIEVITTRLALESCITQEVAFLWTRFIVREDALLLYGFSSTAEREMFDALLKVSGVGAKLAVLILSHMTLDNLRNAVISERPEMLTRVPGIGKKTAQKILLELKDKISIGLDAIPSGDFVDINADVLEALTALGFSVIEAQSAIQMLPQNAPTELQERIVMCLQLLKKA